MHRQLLSLIGRFTVLLGIFGPCILSAPGALLSRRARNRWYARLVVGLERAGATFIKLGQIASSRPDLIPQELCDQLSKLHDQAPAHPFEDSRRQVAEAFGRPLEEIFERFDEQPIASGSIAQVHRALLADGRDAAVKIRHPEAEAQIETDLALIRFLAKLANLVPTARWLSLPGAAENFSAAVHQQLDLEVEARHLERFRKNFADEPQVRFPEPLYPYVHPKVLVESFEQGDKMASYLGRGHELGGAIARGGLAALLKMIFDDGFVHADLHPGNMLVCVDGEEPSVVMLDVGMVAELTDEHRRNYTTFFASLALKDGRNAGEQMIRYSPEHRCKDPEAFIREIEAIFADIEEMAISEVEVAVLLGKVMAAVRKHRIKIESAFTSVNVGLMVLEGIGRQLDPSLNLFEEATPHLLASIFRQQAADTDKPPDA